MKQELPNDVMPSMKPDPEAVAELNKHFRQMEKEFSLRTEPTKPKELPPERGAALLDREIYIPYQAAIDHILDDTFEEQPMIVQMFMGWYAEAFRRYAQKNKDYTSIVVTATQKLHLKDIGRDFGNIIPKEHRPSASHVFKALVKLAQIPQPNRMGDFDYYRVADFPINVKNGFIYPAMEESVPGLLKYLKANRIQLLISDDFVFGLPEALRENEKFKTYFDEMGTATNIDGGMIYYSTPLHKFKFI